MKVTLVHSSDGDWVGMYFDDKLIDQGHSIRVSDVLEHLIKAKKKMTAADEFYAEDWLHDEGHLPKSLKQVLSKNEKFLEDKKDTAP